MVTVAESIRPVTLSCGLTRGCGAGACAASNARSAMTSVATCIRYYRRQVHLRASVLSITIVAIIACVPAGSMAQDQPDAAPAPTWTVAFDGVLFATFDRQTGLRGDTAFVSQNWAMAIAAGPLGSGALTVTGMASAEPLTVGRSGYPEIFQEGETYRGLQMTDRQHPHDLIMQLSAAWRIPLGRGAALTVAGGPVGEAALGPV